MNELPLPLLTKGGQGGFGVSKGGTQGEFVTFECFFDGEIQFVRSKML